MTPAQDLAALAAKLRHADEYEPLGLDGWVAADAIEAQAAEIAWLRAECAQRRDANAKLILENRQLELRAEKAEAALSECQALLATWPEVAAGGCAATAGQVANAAVAGLPEQARLREAMEAALTRAACRIRALTIADAQAALDARINAAREEGLRLAAKICTRGDDRAAILAKIEEAE